MPTRFAGASSPWLRAGVACAVLACATLPALTAHAWTKTRVASADAHLYVNATGEARVRLDLGLRVQGGWLSRFEVVLPDSVLRLDPEAPATLLTQDGLTLMPVTRALPDGKLVFEFADKHNAAWRGLHQLSVTYFTRLPERPASHAGEAELTFTMPAWQVDLEDADVHVTAPPGARLLRDTAPELDGSLLTERLERDGHSVLHSKRVQLPRTQTFAISFSVPRASAASATPRSQHGASGAGAWLAPLVLAIVWLKLLCLRSALPRRGLRAAALLPMPGLLRLLASVGLAGVAATSASPPSILAALIALVSLGLQRSVLPRSDALPGRSSAVLDLFGATSWLDGTTPAGLCLLGSAYALAFARGHLIGTPGAWLEAALLVTPLFFNATRLDGRRASAEPAGVSAAQGVPAANADGGDPRARTSCAGAGLRAPDRAA